jgi:hypothetical protein
VAVVAPLWVAGGGAREKPRGGGAEAGGWRLALVWSSTRGSLLSSCSGGGGGDAVGMRGTRFIKAQIRPLAPDPCMARVICMDVHTR